MILPDSRRDAWTLTVMAALLAGVALMVLSASGVRPAPLPPVPVGAAPPPASDSRREPRLVRDAPSFSGRERAALTRALDRYLDGRAGRLSVAIRDLATGHGYAYGPRLRTATASVVKVDIVLALMLKAQRRGRTLTAYQRSLAARAIKESDNAATDALWGMIGGGDGLAAAHRRLGLRDTVPGPGGAWGSTRTGAADRLRVLAALESGPLSAANRRYLRGLMEDVVPEQAWGVSAAGGRSGTALKNGWLPRQADGGRWTVNSVGRVTVGGRAFALAVLSDRNPTMGAGVTAVEHAARTVAKAFAEGTDPSGDR
ncbi:serine hydrolase [Spirillospora sp. NPDC050679]